MRDYLLIMKYHINLERLQSTKTCWASYLKLPKQRRENVFFQKLKEGFQHQKPRLTKSQQQQPSIFQEIEET